VSGSRKLTLRRCQPFLLKRSPLLLPDERALFAREVLELFMQSPQPQLPVLPFGHGARDSLAGPLVQASLHRLQLSAERLDIGTFVQERFPHRLLFSDELLAQLFKRLATFFDGLLLDRGRITNLPDRIPVARLRDSAL
jgi:hypothetical protein